MAKNPTRKKPAKKPPEPTAVVIVGRCISLDKAVMGLNIARKRLRIAGANSAWVFDGAAEMDGRLAAEQQKLLAEMRKLWPAAADETEAWLATDPALPAALCPPYPHPGKE